MGAGVVVGLQDLVHEHEEVEQPPLRQGCPDGHGPVAFTERLITHVRMDHVPVRLGSRSSLRDDFVGMRPANAVPVQDDPVRSQVDAFQDDCLGQRADMLML